MSQEDLAARTGLSVRTIRYIESGRSGRPRPDTMRLLSEAFGLEGVDRERFHEAAGSPLPVVPAQLPAAAAGFAGRAAELRELAEFAAASGGTRPIGISGTAGVGKTALAVQFAWQVADRYPDGQLYVDLRGFEAAGAVKSPADAMRELLEGLRVPPSSLPDGLDAQAGLYRSLLAGRRMTIVLDNARDAEQVRPLLPGAPGCLVLVTSRHRLTGLAASHGAYLIELDLLPMTDACALLAGRLGAARVDAEPRAVGEIVEQAARLPLALTVVAARAAIRPCTPLRAVAEQLRQARTLDGYADSDATTDIRSVFSWSYDALGPRAAELFALFGVLPAPTLTVPAAASLLGAGPDRVAPLLAELVDAGLLAEVAAGRYGGHDLLRAYAAELAATHPERRAALRRLLDHYLGTGLAADRRLDPHRQPIALPDPAPGVTVPEPDDAEAATAWFGGDHDALLAAVRSAYAEGFDVHAWQLAWVLADHLERSRDRENWVALQQTAIAAARRLGDPAAGAHSHRGLALAYNVLGRYDDACAELEQAFALFESAGDRAGQARAQLGQAYCRHRQGRFAEAVAAAERAVDLLRDGPLGTLARALNSLGYSCGHAGQQCRALECCERALEIQRRIGDRYGAADTLDSLGFLYGRCGDYLRACDYYTEALEHYRAVGERYASARALQRLGDMRAAGGNLDCARAAWQEALDIFGDLDDGAAMELRERLAAAG